VHLDIAILLKYFTKIVILWLNLLLSVEIFHIMKFYVGINITLNYTITVKTEESVGVVFMKKPCFSASVLKQSQR